MPSQAVDVSTVIEIQKLCKQNASLKAALRKSETYQLMKDIEKLEEEDRQLECMVGNLHKEVDQVIRAAKRLQNVAALEQNEALEKINRAKLCIQTIIEEEGDFLSDPDAFVESYCDRLDSLVDKYEEDLGDSTNFMSLHRETMEPDCPLSALNEANRRRLLVQVEIERVNEEIRAELEYSAMIEPISHPILDFEEDLDAEAEILEGLEFGQKHKNQIQPFVPDVFATNKQTNICIQNAVNNLTARCGVTKAVERG